MQFGQEGESARAVGEQRCVTVSRMHLSSPPSDHRGALAEGGSCILVNCRYAQCKCSSLAATQSVAVFRQVGP
eukprot:4423345-Lingulodinium_polyedra.AAC.1